MMYTFSKLYRFPPKFKNKNEDISTLFSPHVTDEETKHKEKLLSSLKARVTSRPSFPKTKKVPRMRDFQHLHREKYQANREELVT